MAQPMAPRHLFPGSNTPRGYYSFYDHILPCRQATKIFIIKGGPGTGKSTIMKRLAREMFAHALDVAVEYHHCSADPRSLDAVVFGGQVAIIDGTTPHAVEPRFPGAVEEILHFGAFWDAEGIEQNRDRIIALTTEKQKAFNRAFAYLKAARTIQEQIDLIHSSQMDFGALSPLFADVINEFFVAPIQQTSEHAPEAPSERPLETAVKAPSRRHLFGRAITPDGFVDHLENVIGQVKHRVVIHGPSGTGKSTFVRRVTDTASSLGYAVECFHSPMDPEKIDHVIIPALDLSVTTTEQLKAWHADSHTIVHTIDYMGPAGTHARDALARAQDLFKLNFDAAIEALIQAKLFHAGVESLYSPHMDFDRLNDVFQQVSLACKQYFRYTES